MITSIRPIDPNNFSLQQYNVTDDVLIKSTTLDTEFDRNTDVIDFCIYDLNGNKLYPTDNYAYYGEISYTIREGDILFNPIDDLDSLGFDTGVFNTIYNFYRKRLSSDSNQEYYIKEISSDRTELKLASNVIPNVSIVDSVNEFIQYRENASYFVDFNLVFGPNENVIANNIQLDTSVEDNTIILIKLYDPLPSNYGIKTELYVVEKLSAPQGYQVEFADTSITADTSNEIKGPNFNLNVKDLTSEASQLFNLDNLLNSNVTSSTNQLNSLLKEKQIQISTDFDNYSNFVNFSSALTRLENFYYKVGLIEDYDNQISKSLATITGDTRTTFAFSSSKATLDAKKNKIINNFDNYEYFLYYNSGSKYSWPKSNSTTPYTLYNTGSAQALNWIGSADEGSAFYGGQALSASNFDENNNNNLLYSIPDYLRDDPSNKQYELFVELVAQHYDNVWIYIQDITNKFNADNRLDFGISKDLVADAIRDFGVNLYSNNFNNDDLYLAFLGITASGSAFPVNNITSSLPTPTGYEYVNTKISASNEVIPLDDANKRLYKRIYHNMPYLLKSKGTIPGLRALITSYGIPDTILRINEYGGKDRTDVSNWDLKQKYFNYAFDVDGTNFLSSSFEVNRYFASSTPRSIQFRFKTNGIPTGSSFDRTKQTLWVADGTSAYVTLNYTGSALNSGSYSGSTVDPQNKYGTLTFYPEGGNSLVKTSSLYLPFFDGGWWSVMASNDYGITNTASLHAGNRIADSVGFHESSSVTGVNPAYWQGATDSYFPYTQAVSIGGVFYSPFSGSYQEIRYFGNVMSGSLFEDYVMSPYSFEGQDVNFAPNQLAFRADLGTQLDTASRTSIHPRITGSSDFRTSSFNDNTSDFFIATSSFVTNVENVYIDQSPGGIKNRVSDRIQIQNALMPVSLNTSLNNTTGSTLSAIRSLQQDPPESSSYTPVVNYLEVAFSPQDQINDDISAQMGHFNLGDYIGDPRQISESGVNYPNLDTLRDNYFKKYISGYNVTDFIRLIKFFDNSLFKMIKDFVPARTSLSSGVVVKQHILERNRQRPAQVTASNETFTGSIKVAPKGFSTGSADFPIYSTSGSSIYMYVGGTGGSFEKYNGLYTSPSSSAYGLINRFGLTQSFSESKEGVLGREIVSVFNQDEFYNGEFSGSEFTATTQSLNPDCAPYLKPTDDFLRYNPLFFSDELIAGGTVTNGDWLSPNNVPLPGDVWFISDYSPPGRPPNNPSYIKYIKIAEKDLNNNTIGNYLVGSEYINFLFREGFKTYFIDGVVENAGYTLLRINNVLGDYNFTSSADGGSENWSVEARGDNTSSGVINGSGELFGFDPNTQGKFHGTTQFQTQVFRYYNGSPIGDPLGLFDTGSANIPATQFFGNPVDYLYGAYRGKRTSNVPWIFSASLNWSASGGAEGAISIASPGVYQSGSYFGAEAISSSLSFLPQSPQTIGNEMFAAYDLTNTGSIVPTPQRGQTSLDGTIFDTARGVNGIDRTTRGDIFSQSSAAGSGHTLVKTTGSAVMQLSFPSLQLGGLPEPPRSPNIYRDFSGSALQPLNGNFFNNTSNMGPGSGGPGNYGNLIEFNSGSTNGEIQFNAGAWYNAYKSAQGIVNFNNIRMYIEFNGIIQDNAGGTINDPTPVQFAVATLFKSANTPNANTLQRGGLPFPNFGAPNTPPGGTEPFSGFNEFYLVDNSSGGPSTSLLYDLPPEFFVKNNGTNGTGTFHLRPQIKSAQSKNYTITRLRVILNIEANNDSVTNNQGAAYNIQDEIVLFDLVQPQNPSTTLANQLNQVTSFSASEIRAKSRLSLWYSGSNGKFVMTQSDWTERQDVRNQQLLTYPDSPIALPQRTSSFNVDHYIVSASGGPVTLQYTDYLRDVTKTLSLTNAQSASVRVRTGGTIPTKTGGAGTLFTTHSEGPYTYGSSSNASGSMYYASWDFANYVGAINRVTGKREITFENELVSPSLELTQSVGENSSGFGITASVNMYKGDATTVSNLGPAYNLGTILINNSESVGFNAFTSSFFYGYQDTDAWRLGVEVDKINTSFVDFTAFTMSFFPSESRFASINTDAAPYGTAQYGSGVYGGESTVLGPGFGKYSRPTPVNVIVPLYYSTNILPFGLADDCQPLINNFLFARINEKLMQVSYNNQTGSILPVNFAQIISGSAIRAAVPQSNYTIKRIKDPRYDGVKTTSQYLNIWSQQDTNTYGQLPVIELRSAYMGYFNSVKSVYPIVNNVSQLNFTHLIDADENAIPPSLQEGIGQSILNSTFTQNTDVSISVQSGSDNFLAFNDQFQVLQLGANPVIISYSQTGTATFAGSIPLTSSRNISQWDNPGTGFNSYSFTAIGSSSIAQNSTTAMNQVVDPGNVTIYSATLGTQSYQDTGAYQGSIIFPITDNHGAQGAGDQKPLSQDYFVSMETDLQTSNIRESGKIEMEAKVIFEVSSSAETGYVKQPPTLDDIVLSVKEISGNTRSLGSVAFGKDDIIRFVTGRRTRNTRRQRRRNGLNKRDRRRGTQKPVVNLKNEIEVVMENYAINRLLKQNGYPYGKHATGLFNLIWSFSANAGTYIFKQGDIARFRIEAFTRGSKNSLFPAGAGGTQDYMPSTIKMQGSKDYLTEQDNRAVTPYWVYTGSAGGATNILNQSILVMSSSNYNEAYGADSYQGQIPYTPGASAYFPTNMEPADTTFGPSDYPLLFAIDDEIRFGSNENNAFKIIGVEPPSKNVEANGIGRIKITLDREVPQTLNKNNFIIRRYIPNANSVIIDAEFPFPLTQSSGATGNNGNASGIMFPDFPATNLQASSSTIITNLVSKGIIT